MKIFERGCGQGHVTPKNSLGGNMHTHGRIFSSIICNATHDARIPYNKHTERPTVYVV